MGRIVSLCGGGSRVRLFFRRGKSQQWAENTIPPNTCQAIEGDKQLAGFHASLANAEEGNIPGFPKTPGNRCQPSYQPNMSFNVQPMAYTTDSIKGEVIGKFDLYKNPMDLIRNSLSTILIFPSITFLVQRVFTEDFNHGRSIMQCVQEAVDVHVDLDNLHRECSTPGPQCTAPPLLIHTSKAVDTHKV